MRTVTVPEDTRGIGTPERDIKDEEGRVVGSFDNVDVLRLRLSRYVAQNQCELANKPDVETWKELLAEPPAPAPVEPSEAMAAELRKAIRVRLELDAILSGATSMRAMHVMSQQSMLPP